MKTLLLIFIFIISLQSRASRTSTQGAMTFINLNQKISPFSSLTYYHYDIFNFETKKFRGEDFHAGTTQSYFQLAYNYQYLPSLSLTAGYIFQRSFPFDSELFQNENRLFEQVTIGQIFRAFTLTHRFRFEQRFIDHRGPDVTYMRTRMRYQIGAKVPLRGIVLDAGELFLNTYNEFYFSTTGERNAFLSDDWVYLGLGQQTKSWGSFELGPMIQYSVVNERKDSRYHVLLMGGWSYSFI